MKQMLSQKFGKSIEGTLLLYEDFDTLGYIDYIVRSAPYEDPILRWEDFLHHFWPIGFGNLVWKCRFDMSGALSILDKSTRIPYIKCIIQMNRNTYKCLCRKGVLL